MDKIPVPLTLDLLASNKSNSWKMFYQKWKNYEVATDLNEKSDEKRVATLLAVIGDDALKVYNTFQWEDVSQAVNYADVISKFEAYCNPKKNIAYERYIFNLRKQRESEKIDDFVTDLKSLASSCEFGALEESLIRDKLILGIRDSKMRESMLRELDLPLDKALLMARSTERAKFQAETIINENTEDIDKIESKSNNDTVIKCKFCGKTHVLNRSKCPAYGKTCNNCKKLK